jgi:NADH-quinone oxidoreductase subunit N
VAAYYYLRIIVVMYMRESRNQEAPVAPISMGLGFALGLSLAATIFLGVYPNPVLKYAALSVGLLH